MSASFQNNEGNHKVKKEEVKPPLRFEVGVETPNSPKKLIVELYRSSWKHEEGNYQE